MIRNRLATKINIKSKLRGDGSLCPLPHALLLTKETLLLTKETLPVHILATFQFYTIINNKKENEYRSGSCRDYSSGRCPETGPKGFPLSEVRLSDASGT